MSSEEFQFLDAPGLRKLVKGLDQRYGTPSSSARLSNARTIALNGDVSGSVEFDGSTNVTLEADIESISPSEIIALMNARQAEISNEMPDNYYS